jgi:hypothetical protein
MKRDDAHPRELNLSISLQDQASSAHQAAASDDDDEIDDPEDDEPATPEQNDLGLRGMAAVLGVISPPKGDPASIGTCQRCEQVDLPLWPTGHLLACEPCWRAREAVLAKLSADSETQQAEPAR